MDWRSKRAKELIDALGMSGSAEKVPESAIKALREQQNLTQIDLGDRAGLSQSMIYALERGQRSLSLKSARQLAPALGVDEEDLLVAEKISELKRAAMKGELNPRRLVEAIEDISHSLDDSSEVDNALAAALVEVLQKALSNYGAARPGVAMKSKREKHEGGRTGMGIKREKPYDPRRYGR